MERFQAAGRTAITGAVIWSVGSVWLGWLPTSPNFPRLVISLAALVLFPLLDDIALRSRTDWLPPPQLRLAAAALMTCSLMLPAGVWSTILVGPWAVLLIFVAVRTVIVALRTVGRLRLSDWSAATEAASIARFGGLTMPGVGALWLVQASLGLRPMGFSHEIVILTAMHFHFAGAVLPILVSEAARRRAGPLATVACLGILSGVPLVAAGITATQLRSADWIESFAALWMAASGLGGAVVLAVSRPSGATAWTDGLRLISSGSLVAGMLFAAAYGLRRPLGLEGLTVPVMQASHGLLMSVAFAACGTIAEWLAEGPA